jgi:hypothetical protein
MARAESSPTDLDKVMASAASLARAARANHARVDAASHAASSAPNRAGVDTANYTTVGTANRAGEKTASHAVPTALNRAGEKTASHAVPTALNRAGVNTASHAAPSALNRAGVNTANHTTVATANRADEKTASHAAPSAPNRAGVNTANHTTVATANRADEKTVSHAAPSAANRAGENTANHAGVDTADRAESGIQRDPPPAPEAPLQIDQFGPLPRVLRVLPSGEREVRRWGPDNGEGRAISLRWLIAIVLAAGLAWALTAALAQQQPANPKPAAAAPGKNAPVRPPPKQQPQQAQQQQPALPVSTEQTLYLIRSTLLTLNDANRSGNYTVLRDLAAPDFQARNSAADLSQSFSDLRHRNFDLYGAALLAPQLTAVPALDQRGFLHLTGFFPTRPQQIDFDLLFADVGNQWRLFGIAVNTPQAPTAER